MFTKKEKVIESKGHQWVNKTFHSFVWCDHCSDFLWGLSSQGYKCMQCKLILHKKCIEESKHCNKIKTVRSVRKLTNDTRLVSNKEYVQKQGPLPPTDIPTHYINLSLPPKERFKEVAQIYSKQLHEVKTSLFKHIPEKLQFLAKESFHLLDDALGEYGQEIEGIAEGCGLDKGVMLLLNLAYELTDYCTSIVACSPSGEILHARNQDFDPSLRGVVVHAVYVNSARQELFKAITFAGFAGIPTGFVEKRFSISINAREKLHGNIFENIFSALLEKGLPSCYVVRKALENRGTFVDTIEFIKKQPLISPTYFIIAGTKGEEGAIITRNRVSTENTIYLNPAGGVWYLAQTNHDHWEVKVPEKIDRDEDKTVLRLEVARKKLNELGREKVSLETLNEVLLTEPVLNGFTLYSSLMSPILEAFHSYRVKT